MSGREAMMTRMFALDCICLAPPLVTTDAEIDRIVSIVGETIPAVVAAAGVAAR